MIVGKTAIKITPKHITQSKLTQESETASSPLPFVIDISEQIGRICKTRKEKSFSISCPL